MKILNPGKVEMRKFVCPRCRCLFVASYYETKLEDGRRVWCPQCGKTNMWNNGEPYEEPKPTQTDADRLAKLLFDSMPMSSVGRYDLAADYLIANGVAFGRAN